MPLARRTPESCRKDFPALRRTLDARPLVYLDGPAGTQVPDDVIRAVSEYYSTMNANTHGDFLTSRETDRMLAETRERVADFLGAAGSSTISFGANMTTLAYALARAIGRECREGDEVLITQLDHEANRGPWLSLRERGVVVREIAVRPGAVLDYDDLRSKCTSRTRLVAIGGASNAFGTVNDIALAREASRAVGALLLVDAVHYAPHFSVDVQAMDVDFLLCSAYKFYGPHVGVLYARPGLLDRMEPDRLVTQDQQAPYRIETGTLNHAALAGVRAAVEYVASFGTGTTLRGCVLNAFAVIGAHERRLASRLYEGLVGIRGITVHGQAMDVPRRAPTLAFTADRLRPAELSGRLAGLGVCTWSGNFYAARPMEILGLAAGGGVVRAGLSVYSTEEDLQRLIDGVRTVLG